VPSRYSRGFRAWTTAFVLFGVPATCLLLVGRTYRSLPLLALGGLWLLLGLGMLGLWLRRRVS